MRLINPQVTKGDTTNSASQINVNMSQEQAMPNLERNGFTHRATRSPNTYYLERIMLDITSILEVQIEAYLIQKDISSARLLIDGAETYVNPFLFN